MALAENSEVQNNAYSLHGATETGMEERARGDWPWARFRNQRLAISCHRTQLAGQEVIRGPGAADGYFAVLQLLGSGAVAVLILFDALVVDQVGDIDEHALRRDLLAADFFLERVKQLVNLNGQRAGL